MNPIGSRVLGLEGSGGFMLTNTSAISESIKDNPEIAGAFPRWISLGTVQNPDDYSQGETGSFVAYGVRFHISHLIIGLTT